VFALLYPLREIRKPTSAVFFLLPVFQHDFFLNITDSSQKYGNMYKIYDNDLWVNSAAQEYRKDSKR